MSETKVSIQRQAKLSQSLVSGLKTLARQEKEKERKPKQRDGCKQALAMAVLEYSTLSTQGGARKGTQHVVPNTGALAFFVKQYPDLAKKCHISIGKHRLARQQVFTQIKDI
ncbi:hypothetical protein AK812_SmicGene4703 [Symbiodinium microadriaticum]|uniref:Uncharacterized protein n=1 Tax=Symbiodinium microadriaticum TaxID=2951 RepID=A0A1Q9EVQ4_SYMMI|nr:hypothetical protein AK812_SmicGene4703 [Symbiodinium microadriaticum]